MKPPRLGLRILPLIGLLGIPSGAWAQDTTTATATASASYSAGTTVTTSGAQASVSAMPPLAPTNTLSATAPTGSAYVLNSTFDINDDAVTRTYDFVLA